MNQPDLCRLIPHITFPIDDNELTQAQRLFHGRGHAYTDLHHITIDWLSPVILITLFAPETQAQLKKLAAALLVKLPSCSSVQVQHRHQRHGPIDILAGRAIQDLVVQENQLKYQIQLGKSRNTGLFLDIKNGRHWVQQHSKNQRVLNLFAYTCGFSVAAIAGGASAVLNVDTSSPALNMGRINHQLNQQPLSRVKFEKLNILKSFGRLKKRGPFDLLICDPPTFQKGSVDIVKDYPKILRRLDQFMAPSATLMLCLNAPELGHEFLTDNMQSIAPEYQLLETIKPPEVYAEVQDKGLKVLIFSRSSYGS